VLLKGQSPKAGGTNDKKAPERGERS